MFNQMLKSLSLFQNAVRRQMSTKMSSRSAITTRVWRRFDTNMEYEKCRSVQKESRREYSFIHFIHLFK